MQIIILLMGFLMAMVIAFVFGKLVSKIKLPAILGWLIVGMILGPNAVGLISGELLNAPWFSILIDLLECIFGLMIGTEMIMKELKKAGSQIIVTTITESFGTFLVVSLVFAVVFYLADIPLYLAVIVGAIALATAPAPSLSVVKEFKTAGPVTKTLIPMAALDDLVGALVFFSVMAGVSSLVTGGSISFDVIIIMVFMPIIIGALIGFIAGKLMNSFAERYDLPIMLGMMFLSALCGIIFNSLVEGASLNFMLIGMSYSTVFANCIAKERVDAIMRTMNPIIGVALIIVILNLAAPLDYHLIYSAGAYSFIYIISRAFGKYSGAYFGAAVTKAPETVKKYLGFTLLPHSGVSLVFTGIASSTLMAAAPECAEILQGTIAAAAVINEIIAVFMAKKGFEWAGELYKAKS